MPPLELLKTSWRELRWAALTLMLIACAFGCSEREPRRDASASGGMSHPASPPAHTVMKADSERPPAVGAGNAERGKELVVTHECQRCHEGTGVASVARAAHCTSCHQEILAGTFPASKDKLAKWRSHVGYVRRVPSLVGSARLSRDFIADFLLNPHDLRPALEPTMPRLALTPADARDIATYLTATASDTASDAANTGDPLAGAEPSRGPALMASRGCGACHGFTGTSALSQTPAVAGAALSNAVLLAPDLRHVRRRMSAATLVRWLRDPQSLKADTLMPAMGLDPSEARDLAAYLLTTPLASEPERPRAVRLPPLERAVTFAEVDEKVLRVTCRHCHSNPDIALGDGGPGNTGGFGFPARHIDFSSYRGVASGFVDARGERHSLFEPTETGVPRLVAALLARKDEEAGHPNPEIRGMPLGLPSLSDAQIQLVDTWIAQGRPE